ncbi:hypothetical protein SK128_005856 [Halocaridina rubra]|uniref:Uncharacterized protein n=1 Tax=Halocaridina rubra TaxID=373956 RepID=A0AAN8X703_HALRR
MSHYMGLDNFVTILGASFWLQGFGHLMIGPFTGYLHYLTQSYAVCTCFLAGLSFMSFLLWIAMPAAVAYDHRKERDKLLKKRTSDISLQP